MGFFFRDEEESIYIFLKNKGSSIYRFFNDEAHGDLEVFDFKRKINAHIHLLFKNI